MQVNQCSSHHYSHICGRKVAYSRLVVYSTYRNLHVYIHRCISYVCMRYICISLSVCIGSLSIENSD